MTVVRRGVMIAEHHTKRITMYLTDLFNSRDLVVSIEVFPPKSADDDAAVHKTLENLRQYDPAFVFVHVRRRRQHADADPRSL